MLVLLALSAGPALGAETYPLTDPELLAIRRLESEAFHLALKRSGQARARYARTAVVAHMRRMDRLSPAMAEGERRIERLGVGSGEKLERSYPAEDARRRALAVGEAMAVLLDDLDPGWRSDDRPLDLLLDEATRDRKIIPLSDDINGARDECRALQQAITSEATGYLTRAGYSLTVNAPLTPVDDSDPFAAIGLGDGERLYRGDVELEGSSGTLSISGLGAWVSDGEVRVTGLVLDDLLLAHEGDEVVVTGPGLELRMRGATYSGAVTGMIVDVVPGASMEPDAAVFALYALATTAGFEGGRSLQLRDRIRALGGTCTGEIEQYAALGELDELLGWTVVLGDAPDFEVDRDPHGLALAHQREGRITELSDLLGDFWSCADLEPLWREVRPEWIDAGQQALYRGRGTLAAASQVDRGRWPHVRIVPNLLDVRSRGFSTSWEDEVTVFLGPAPGRRQGLDPSLVAHEALHHVVDLEVRGRACPAFDAAHASVADRLTIEPDAWLAESLVRALTVEGGIQPEEAVQGWVAEGYTLVPGILAGLEREPWDVWVAEQCGWGDF